MTDRLRLTILGCGSSPGVPRVGNDWGACDPTNPKNERLRCSLMVERINSAGVTRAIVDTSPDFRMQMLNHQVGHIDAVLYTHPHADHIHGIDDLRGYWIRKRDLIDVYADEQTTNRLMEGFSYCFQTPDGSSYPPIARLNSLRAGETVAIDGAGGTLYALPFIQMHGDITSLGFKFDDFIYSSDINGLSDDSKVIVKQCKTWIVDALRYHPHPSHLSLSEALALSDELNVQRTILTHMHIDLDYDTLLNTLPNGVEPAYDGMVMERATK